eukprot:g1370.t1
MVFRSQVGFTPNASADSEASEYFSRRWAARRRRRQRTSPEAKNATQSMQQNLASAVMDSEAPEVTSAQTRSADRPSLSVARLSPKRREDTQKIANLQDRLAASFKRNAALKSANGRIQAQLDDALMRNRSLSGEVRGLREQLRLLDVVPQTSSYKVLESAMSAEHMDGNVDGKAQGEDPRADSESMPALEAPPSPPLNDADEAVPDATLEQLRDEIRVAREVLSVARMDNIIRGEAEYFGLEELQQQLAQMIQSFTALSRMNLSELSPEKFHSGPSSPRPAKVEEMFKNGQGQVVLEAFYRKHNPSQIESIP